MCNCLNVSFCVLYSAVEDRIFTRDCVDVGPVNCFFVPEDRSKTVLFISTLFSRTFGGGHKNQISGLFLD